MTYLAIKAVHLAAAITWAGGMLMLSVLLGLMTRQPCRTIPARAA